MATKKRKYDEEYISPGFTVTLDRDGTEKSQCFLCGKVLANSSMKPVKLKEHLNANHPVSISDSCDTFLQKKTRFEVSGTLDKYGFISTENRVTISGKAKIGTMDGHFARDHIYGLFKLFFTKAGRSNSYLGLI